MIRPYIKMLILTTIFSTQSFLSPSFAMEHGEDLSHKGISTRQQHGANTNSSNYAVEALDEVLGSIHQPHTLNWCIYHSEINVKPSGVWSGIPSVRDDIMPVHILGNGLYKLKGNIDGLKNKYRSIAPSMNKAVEALDEVLGSIHQPHTLNWCIYHSEINVKPNGAWAGIPSVRDDIMPVHILGNGLYPLKKRVEDLKQGYLPTAFRFTGEILDVTFDTGLFNNLVQQYSIPTLVVSKTVFNPEGSNVETIDSFTHKESIQESISLKFETLQEQLVERFSELRFSTHSTTNVGGEASASLFGLIKLGVSADHTSVNTTNSTDQTRTRNAKLTRNGRTVMISSDTSYEIHNTLKAKPGSHVKQDWFVNIFKNAGIPFEAKLLVRATRTSNSAACGTDIIQELLLMSYGVQATDISPGSENTSISCKVRGNMAVSLGCGVFNKISKIQ